MPRLCAVSIDVDPIPCYYRIHALGPPPAELRDLIMRRCVPRFAALFERLGIRATFFLVGQDLDTGELGAMARAARSRVAELSAAGHELGNHSYSHPYELARLGAAETEREIVRAHELIGEVSAKRVRGFRAPGYDLSARMVEVLLRLGYRYDSSIFPAPGYYAAKAAVMAGLELAGRPSGAVLTNPLALLAPANPYRPSVRQPWRPGQASIVELPIAVTPIARIPVIGTSLLLAPEWLRTRWIRAMRRRPFFNLELHGIDLADADADGIPGELVSRQPDLRAPMQRKLVALENTLERLAREGWEFVTLAEAAAWAQREAA